MLRLEKIPSLAKQIMAVHWRRRNCRHLCGASGARRSSQPLPSPRSRAPVGTRSWPCDGAISTLRKRRCGSSRRLSRPKGTGCGSKGRRRRRTATISIDDDTLALLLAERERHLRIVAGAPDGVPVDVSLVKLPDGAFMFPNPPAPGGSFSLAAPRNPRNTTKEFVRKAASPGFPGLRLHEACGCTICAARARRTYWIAACPRQP